jgi:hypothetical protein
MANDTDLVPKKKDDDEEDEERRTRYAPGEAETARPMPPVSAGEPATLGEMPTTRPREGESEYTRGRIGELEQRLNPPRAQGTLPRIGRVFRNIGEIAGGAVAPGVMMQIPGTRLNTMAQLAAERERLEQEQQRESMEPLRAAQTEEALGRATEARAAARTKGLPEAESGESNIFTQSDEAGNVTGQWQRFKNPADPLHPIIVPVQVPGQGAPGAAPAPPEAGMPRVTQQPAPPLAGPITTGKPSTLSAEQREEKRVMDLGARVARGETLNADDQKFFDANLAKYQTKLPIGPQGVKTAQDELGQILSGSNIPATAFKFDPRMSYADRTGLLRDARDQADRARTYGQQETMQDKREADKDKRTPVYAVNPNTGDVEKSNRYQAERVWNTSFREINPNTEKEDSNIIRNLNDVQLNTSRYRHAMDAIPTDISQNHALLMQQIIGDDKINAGLVGGMIPGADYILSTLKGTSLAKSWNTLTDKEQDALIGYIRAKSAVIAYQKALTNSARFTERQLNLEMANIPVPFMGATLGDKQMNAWQENIDAAARGLPVNLPGQMAPKYYRQQLEREERPAAAAAPAAGGKGKWNLRTNRYD